MCVCGLVPYRYGAAVSTFLVQAFLFDANQVDADAAADADDAGDGSLGPVVVNLLVGAFFANVILSPIQYVAWRGVVWSE